MNHRIKKALDQIVGKEKIFTDKDKKAIYSRIQNEGDQQMKFRRKNKFGIALSYGLTAALLFVLAWAGFQHILPSEKASSVNKSSKVHKTSSSKKTQHHSSTVGAKKQGATIQQLLKQKPKLDTKGAKQYPKKFQIVKTMYDAWNHIHNIQAQVEAGYPQLGYKGETTFYLDLDHQRNLAQQSVTKQGNPLYSESILYQNHKMTMVKPKQKVYTDLHFQNNKRGNYNVYESLNFYTRKVTNNSSWVFWLANNYKSWSYKEGTKLGLPVYEIKGKTLGDPYKMIIAKNTGVLLDFKEYDHKHQNALSTYLTVKSIKINKGIPASQFKLNVSGDKNLAYLKYSDGMNSGGIFDRGKICASNCTMN